MGVADHLATTGGIRLPRATGSNICAFHLMFKSMHEFEWYQSDLLKKTERTLKRIKI